MRTILAITLLACATPAVAQEVKEDCSNQTQVKVNGLVCDFCARALEKVFSKREEVEKIKVDLENGNITITRNAGKTLDDDTIKTLIGDSGYNVTSISAGCQDEAKS